MRLLAIEPLAQSDGFVLGLCTIRGTSVPVVDVGALLGAGDAAQSTRLVMVRVEERVVALAVEAVLGIRAVASQSLQDLPPLLGEASTALIASIGAVDGAFLLVLQAARILADAHASVAVATHA